ncbi:hypothetical protein OBBRIDRAFT_539292 [Obba rivulosa]|uniref:Uncharacterized protein n=1 Tax=Obba rivulosa TaxID=1052685 RepID=A0A8E2J6A4_9APHY|nr:hypothetical protein OBBRIDRAFT_539292 [Obba rivulosa]
MIWPSTLHDGKDRLYHTSAMDGRRKAIVDATTGSWKSDRAQETLRYADSFSLDAHEMASMQRVSAWHVPSSSGKSVYNVPVPTNSDLEMAAHSFISLR